MDNNSQMIIDKENKILILFAFWAMKSWHMWIKSKKTKSKKPKPKKPPRVSVVIDGETIIVPRRDEPGYGSFQQDMGRHG